MGQKVKDEGLTSYGGDSGFSTCLRSEARRSIALLRSRRKARMVKHGKGTGDKAGESANASLKGTKSCSYGPLRIENQATGCEGDGTAERGHL